MNFPVLESQLPFDEAVPEGVPTVTPVAAQVSVNKEKAATLTDVSVLADPEVDTRLTVIQNEHPQLAVLDLKMPGKSGMELLKEIRHISPEIRAVMLTGYGSITNAVEAIKHGAVNYVTKPADADQVLAALDEHPAMMARQPEDDLVPPSLAEAQWEHIHRVLADCDGNVSEAARRLGIHRRSLQRKLRKLAPD